MQAFSGLYIERTADRELLDLCRQGVFAYVLTARQMGKSSLMVSTAERLAAEGVRSVIVDLQKFGTQVTAEALRNSAEHAKAQAIDAQQSERILRSQTEIRALLFAIQTTPDPELGLMIAIEGVRRDPENPVLVDALRAAIVRSPLRSVLRGHTADLTSAAFSPDGARIVTTSYDTTARIWDWRAILASTTATFTDSTKGLTSAAFSPDSQYIAAGGQDTQVHIVAAATGAAAIDTPLRANSEPLYSVAFSPDGRLVITASRDSTARVGLAGQGARRRAARPQRPDQQRSLQRRRPVCDHGQSR